MFRVHPYSMALAMTWGTITLAFYGAGAAAIATSLAAARRRLELSQAKHPTIAGHSRIAHRLAAFVPFYEYDERQFFCSDGASDDVAARRRAGFEQLAALYKLRFAESGRRTAEASEYIPDVQFTDAYRVPFQYRRIVRANLPVGVFLQSADGVTVTDLDGNRFYDLAGSYGVNILGYDFYKDAIERGVARVRDLGPLLGSYHPVVLDNVKRLRDISGLDEVSFHMSGTEAVMQAVRLARYHTRRTHLVRFCGAYHGWWGDVQPGIGNPLPAHESYTLRDMSEESLRVLRTRRDIACVLINPEQALHPNGPAPNDSALVDSARTSHFDKDTYAVWLKRLRQICTEQNIVLIIDEIFVGFRLAAGGAQDYFGVRADLVTYGKTLGGGLPVGVVCGRKDLMKRYRDDRPADICFARGTFNSHPYVMAAMNEFLRQLATPQTQALYHGLDETWNERARRLNQRLSDEGLPVQVANMSSLFVVCYTQPSRYNWVLQYYLRAQGLSLSWVGTARLIFSLSYTDADFNAVADRFVVAAKAMQRDGWWWHDPKATNKSIKRAILKEMIAHRLFGPRNSPAH
jgi:glutamate-1-semialdehyde 2,1-aminomutase